MDNNQKKQQARDFMAWLLKWLQATMPGVCRVRVAADQQTLQVRDALGWRDVGTVPDYVAVARALGVVRVAQ